MRWLSQLSVLNKIVLAFLVVIGVTVGVFELYQSPSGVILSV